MALGFYHLKMETIVYFQVLDIFINVQNAITSLLYKDIYLSAKEYPLEKDKYLADILMKIVPEEFQECMKNDVLWFLNEVVKGEESKYYGKN